MEHIRIVLALANEDGRVVGAWGGPTVPLVGDFVVLPDQVAPWESRRPVGRVAERHWSSPHEVTLMLVPSPRSTEEEQE